MLPSSRRIKYSLGETRFRQEYLCEFLQPDDCVFPADLVDAALADEDFGPSEPD